MFQVIQKSKTEAKVRTWKNDLYKRIWEEVYKDIDKKNDSGYYKGQKITYYSMIQDRKELTEVIPKFYERDMGTFKTLDIAKTVVEKCNLMFSSMEHEIVEK